MSGQKGELHPGGVEFEFDFHAETPYAGESSFCRTPFVESSHAIIMYLSYLGADEIFADENCFRAVQSTVEFHSPLPSPGVTLRGVVSADRLLCQKGRLLVWFTYRCYHNDQHLLTLKGINGLFPRGDLLEAQGIVKEQEVSGRVNQARDHIFRSCDKSAYDEAAIDHLQNGRRSLCFNEHYSDLSPKKQLYIEHVRMIYRVIQVDPLGGKWGFGVVISEANINPDHWAFAAHFINDPVLPGSLQIEGFIQAINFYAHYLGVHDRYQKLLKVKEHLHSRQSTFFKGQVPQKSGVLRYEVEIKKISFSDDGGEVIFDGKAFFEGRLTLYAQDLGITLSL